MNFHFDLHERQAWAPPPELKIWEWAERDVVLPRGVSSSPGPCQIVSFTPYLVGPLEAATDPEVEEITLCWSTQLGKTTVVILVVLYTLSQNPWNALHVAAREDDASEICVERYVPTILESPALRALFTGAKHELTRAAIRANGCTINFRGANSPAALSSKNSAILVLDEVDKYPPWAGNEADPIKLARERTRTFPMIRKILKTSTPTTQLGYILRELEQSTCRHYHVPCPHCGVYQVLVMGSRERGEPGIKWPTREALMGVYGSEAETAAGGADVIIQHRLAFYECAACHRAIEDRDKPKMLSAGLWVPRGGRVEGGHVVGEPRSRRHEGYHLWAAYSPWLTYSEIAAEFLRSKDYPGGLMNFRNSWQAEAWQVVQHELDEGHLKARRAGYRQGSSMGGWLLTAGVDVQADGAQTYQYYVIRAWGARGESWLVRAGRSEGWEALYEILFRSVYRVVDDDGEARGEPLPLLLVLTDDGFRQDEVHQWVELTHTMVVRGAARLSRHLKVESIPTPSKSSSIRRVQIDTSYFKTKVHRFIRSERWHLPIDTEEEYFRQMSAEQLVQEVNKRTGRPRYAWKVAQQGRANHLFDCEVYAAEAAELLELDNREDPPPVVKPGRGPPRGGEPIRIRKKTEIFSS